MDLYEYQARELLEEQGIPTPKAIFAQTPMKSPKRPTRLDIPM